MHDHGDRFDGVALLLRHGLETLQKSVAAAAIRDLQDAAIVEIANHGDELAMLKENRLPEAPIANRCCHFREVSAAVTNEAKIAAWREPPGRTFFRRKRPQHGVKGICGEKMLVRKWPVFGRESGPVFNRDQHAGKTPDAGEIALKNARL